MHLLHWLMVYTIQLRCTATCIRTFASSVMRRELCTGCLGEQALYQGAFRSSDISRQDNLHSSHVLFQRRSDAYPLTFLNSLIAFVVLCCVSCKLLLCLFKFALFLFSSTQATLTHLLARHPSTILDILAHQYSVVSNPVWYHCSCWFGLSRACSSQCSWICKVWILVRRALVDLLTSAAFTPEVHKDWDREIPRETPIAPSLRDTFYLYFIERMLSAGPRKGQLRITDPSLHSRPKWVVPSPTHSLFSGSRKALNLFMLDGAMFLSLFPPMARGTNTIILTVLRRDDNHMDLASFQISLRQTLPSLL